MVDGGRCNLKDERSSAGGNDFLEVVNRPRRSLSERLLGLNGLNGQQQQIEQ